MIKPNKLATSVATVLGASAIASGAAVAGAGLWPHVVFSPSVTTVVSVINSDSRLRSADDLHYIFWYKGIGPGGTPPNLRGCQEVNVFLPTSQNDIQSIDLGNVFGASTLGVLFNDPSFQNDWAGANRSFALAAATGVSPLRGYLVVDHPDPGPNVSGDALVLEYTNGAAWGYFAKTDLNVNFQDDGISTGDSVQISAKPFEEITTAFMTTPVGPVMANFGSYSARLELTIGGSGVMYDRDENPVSGSRPQTVTCVGRVEASDLITSGAATFLPDGGWSNLGVTALGTATGAIVYQLEYGEGTFNGEPLLGGLNTTYNNAFELLRN